MSRRRAYRAVPWGPERLTRCERQPECIQRFCGSGGSVKIAFFHNRNWSTHHYRACGSCKQRAADGRRTPAVWNHEKVQACFFSCDLENVWLRDLVRFVIVHVMSCRANGIDTSRVEWTECLVSETPGCKEKSYVCISRIVGTSLLVFLLYK